MEEMADRMEKLELKVQELEEEEEEEQEAEEEEEEDRQLIVLRGFWISYAFGFTIFIPPLS